MEKYEERDWVLLENLGQKIFGVLHKPVNCQNSPAVLMCHGFGGSKSGRYRHYVKLSQALAREGIASLRFDFRGSGDSEGDMKEVTIDGEVSDALIALDYLKKLPFIDASRVGILGRSLGGAIAIQTAFRFKNIASLALWAPLFSSAKWKKMWDALQHNPSQLAQVKELKVFDGTLPNRDFLDQFFALKLEDNLETLGNIPLLHIHASDDEVIDHHHLELYAECRHSAKAQTKMVTLPNANHDFTDPKCQQAAINETVKWFKETL